MTAENATLLEPVLGKDEIGWMFVQEYYTYLNKEPNRLHVGRHNLPKVFFSSTCEPY